MIGEQRYTPTEAEMEDARRFIGRAGVGTLAEFAVALARVKADARSETEARCQADTQEMFARMSERLPVRAPAVAAGTPAAQFVADLDLLVARADERAKTDLVAWAQSELNGYRRAVLAERALADERAKRPDREQITMLVEAWMSSAESEGWSDRRIAEEIAHELLALEPEVREEPTAIHPLEEDEIGEREGVDYDELGIAEVRDVTDAEQCMLVISASWDATGHQPLPRYVGPFPDRDAAFAWVRHHAPLSGEFNSSPWPVRPEAVVRG